VENDEARLRVRQLFHENGAAVYRFALVLVRHHQDAEDVVQETFLKLLRHLEKGGGESNLKGWLFTVAAHACRDRGRFRLRWLPLTPAHDRAETPSREIEARSAGSDEDERLPVLRDCLARLSPRDRLLLTLRAQGLSYRDIAEAASLRPTSVGQLLSRALSRWERAYAQATTPATKERGRTAS
jgi:RNA polymerase sigma-70 factor (ECF subfamily)